MPNPGVTHKAPIELKASPSASLRTSIWHKVTWINGCFFPSIFMLYVAWKRGPPRKCARFVLFRPIKKRSFNLLCVLEQKFYVNQVGAPVHFRTQSYDPISWYGKPAKRTKIKSKDTRFRWSAPLVSRSNWSDRRTESKGGSGPQHMAAGRCSHCRDRGNRVVRWAVTLSSASNRYALTSFRSVFPLVQDPAAIMKDVFYY